MKKYIEMMKQDTEGVVLVVMSFVAMGTLIYSAALISRLY